MRDEEEEGGKREWSGSVRAAGWLARVLGPRLPACLVRRARVRRLPCLAPLVSSLPPSPSPLCPSSPQGEVLLEGVAVIERGGPSGILCGCCSTVRAPLFLCLCLCLRQGTASGSVYAGWHCQGVCRALQSLQLRSPADPLPCTVLPPSYRLHHHPPPSCHSSSPLRASRRTRDGGSGEPPMTTYLQRM